MHKSSKWIVLSASLAAIVLVIGVAVYYFLPMRPSQPSKIETIKIGFITSLTGVYASVGTDARVGAELAVKEINEQGGVKGRLLELVILDDQSKPEQGLANIRLADKVYNVLAVTGPVNSDVALALKGYAEENGLPLIIPVAAAPQLTEPGTKWTVRVEPDSIQWGAAVMKFITKKIPNAKIAIVYANLAFTRQLAAGARWYIENTKSGQIVYDAIFPPTQSDYSTAAAAIKLANPDMIFVAVVSAGNLYASLFEVGFKPNQIIIMADQSASIIPLGTEGIGAYAVSFFSESYAMNFSEGKKFVEAARALLPYYTQASRTLNFLAYFPYITIKLIAKAIENTDPLNRENFIKTIKKLEMKDVFGRTVKFDENGAALTGYFIIQITKLNPADRTYETKVVEFIDFPPGYIPVYEIAKTA
jgi:ABC-type branched-subunit amino acid transport system substrate-binding protein